MKPLFNALKLAFKSEDDLQLLLDYCVAPKTEKGLRELVEGASLYASEVISDVYSNDDFHKAVMNGHIRECSLPQYRNRFYLTISGLALCLSEEGIEWSEALIKAIQLKRLPDLVIRLKKEERLFVIMLLIFGAVDRNKSLKVDTNETKSKLFEYLQSLDSLGTVRSIFGDSEISWGKGKKISWSKFLTEWVDLPKSGIYHKYTRDGADYFYLDLSSSRNISVLKKHLLDQMNVDLSSKYVLHDFVKLKSMELILDINLGYVIPRIDDSILKQLFS